MAFTIKGFLGLDSSGFKKDLDRASEQAQRFTENIGRSFSERIAAAFTGGAIVAGIMKLDDMIKGLQERAKEIRIGVSETGLDPQSYQRFANTLDAVNSSGEAGAKALEHLAEATLKVKNGEAGSEELAKDFAALGISLEDIKKKDFRTVFFQIADGMKSASLSAERMAAIKNTLGKSGLELIPAMKIGFDSKTANHGVLGDDDLAKLAELTKIAKESSAPWKSFGDEVAIALTKIKSGILGLPGTVKDFFTYDGGGDGGVGAMQNRMNSHGQQKAAAQLDQQAAAERAKKEEEIRQSFAKRQDSLQESIGAERYSLLNAKDKLFVLQKQDEVLKQMKGSLEAGIRAGDPTGELGAQLAQVQLMRLKNQSAQAGLSSNDQMPFQAPRQTALNLNSLQQMGALVSTPVNDGLSSAISNLNTTIKNADNTLKRLNPPNGPNGGAGSDGALGAGTHF